MMKKWILTLIAPLALLWSCKIDNGPTDYLQYVVGQWAAVQVDDYIVPTDSIAVFTLNPDFSASVAQMSVGADGRKIWKQIDQLSYTVVDDYITITSAQGAAKLTNIKLEIDYVSSVAMACDVVSYTLDGESRNSLDDISFEKCDGDLSIRIQGIWQNNVTVNGVSEQWFSNFKSGGVYDFYIYDPATKSYKLESIDKSLYKVYGRYLVSIYSDLSGDASGYSVDVWVVSAFTGAGMVWTSYNSGSSIKAIHQFVKVGKLP